MQKSEKQSAIITVIGKDKIGVVAEVSSLLAKYLINIEEISQTIMQDFFVMTMLVDLKKSSLDIANLSKKLDDLGEKIGYRIHIHDERIIQAMHRV